jgi:putative transposase
LALNGPRVNDDNPFSEALFGTLKYRPDWPSSGFASLEVARDWVQQFADWYNTQHRQNKINFVTPSQGHGEEDKKILEGRKLVLRKAKEMSPLRWSGDVRNCQLAGRVSLNPEKESIKNEHEEVA